MAASASSSTCISNYRSYVLALAGFLSGLLVGHLLQASRPQPTVVTATQLQLRRPDGTTHTLFTCPPCQCRYITQQATTLGSALVADAIARSSTNSSTSSSSSQHFCPWDTSQSVFQGADKVLDFGGGQTACYDAIVYGYDLIFERDALFGKTKWLGVPNQQDPSSAMIIQEILFKVKPDVVIELGTNVGGGSLFFASVLSLMGRPFKVIAIDPKDFHQDWYTGDKRCLSNYPCLPADAHPLWNSSVTFIHDVPTKPEVVAKVQALLKEFKAQRVVVIEDSAHHYDMVLDNIRTYHPFVTPGSYLIVQDTKLTRFNKGAACQGRATPQEQLLCLREQAKIGPGDAIATFLGERKDFQADVTWEFLYYTQHAGGYLQKQQG